LFILHLALGGCLKAPPIDFGVTADSGGHLAYVVAAATAQSIRPDVSHVAIVTRRFSEAHLPREHDLPSEMVANGVTIERIATNSCRYLEKEALAAELPSFKDAFLDYLAGLTALPDVIHAHFADAAAIAIEARTRFGIPVAYTPHALAIDKRDQGLSRPGLEARIASERTAILEADALVVSSSDEARRQLPAYGVAVEGRVRIIPPGVPQRSGSTAGEIPTDCLIALLDNPDRPIILAIARPVRKKNLVTLLRAYAADPVLQDMANLVILAGQEEGHSTGEEQLVRQELRALVQTGSLGGKVMLPLRHDAADVVALYRRAAAGGVFVNPALHEPFGLTLIEAAEAGVPVVATCHGGPTEIVETVGHGLLIDPRDEGEIAAACRAIVGDEATHARFRTNALANIGHYDWSRYAETSTLAYRGLRRRPALLACDIDGTLTGCAIGAAEFERWRRSSSLPFVVATGRSFEDARSVLASWKLPEPDAFITDVGTRIMLPTDDGGWRSCADYAAALDGGWHLPTVRAVLTPLGVRPQPDTTAGPHKLSFFGDASDAAAMRAALASARLPARVVLSHRRLIDVLPASGGKAAAVAAYAARLGLTLQDCAVAGDSGNDEDMLEASGTAIVVGNAGEELSRLTPRPGLYRARRHHAAGVLEGLEQAGLLDQASRIAA
jgi:sucrose-phosphate synthase